MNTDAPSKLRTVLEKKGISQAEFARLMNIYPQKVTNWINRGVPSNRALEVAATLGVNVDEIADANFSTQFKQLMSRGAREPSFVYEPGVDTGERRSIAWMVPLISWVAAGTWSEPVDNYHVGDAEEWLPCPPNCREHSTFALRVSGDSMDDGTAQGYHDGDLIFIDGSKNIAEHNADVVIKNGEGQVTFKRLIQSDGTWYLKPLNPNWPTKIIELGSDSHIVGRVMFSGRMR